MKPRVLAFVIALAIYLVGLKMGELSEKRRSEISTREVVSEFQDSVVTLRDSIFMLKLDYLGALTELRIYKNYYEKNNE